MRGKPSLPTVLALALLGAIVVLGVVLRLQDPLSTSAIAAEDPYTHVVFVKEWTEQGYFADSFHLGTGMYPPGMHAFVGIVAPLSGFSLYEFARIAPAFFGGLAIVGIYVLADRLAGTTAALVAAFVTAIMPEHIFRTELLFPTALDLALLPLWLLAFHLACAPGRRGEPAFSRERAAPAALFVLGGVALAFMHPWVVPLFGAPLAVYAAVRVVRAGGPARVAARRMALPAALLVGLVAFAMASRWSESDTGFADFLAKLGPLAPLAELDLAPTGLFVVLAALLGVLAAVAVALVALVASVRVGRRTGALAGAILGGALLAAVPFLARDPPFEVDYRAMLGVLPITLALVGFGLAFVRPTPLGDMAAAIAIALFPLTALDIFESPFWPQRTVAYLAFAVALLAGCAAQQVHVAAMRWVRSPSTRRVAGPALAVALVLSVAGGAVAVPAPTYEWYRLYPDAQFEGFHEVAEILEKDPESRVFIYTWQPALMVKTLADPDHVWYSPKYFQDGGTRAEQNGQVEGPKYVLVDHYTVQDAKKGKCDIGFTKGMKLVYESPDHQLRLYKVG